MRVAMKSNYFEILRAGINTTFQDKGRENLYHIGIPFSGVMDNRNFLLANKLVGNHLTAPVIEFAYQGPHLRYSGDQLNFVITGDVIFKIKKKDNEIDGDCYQSYHLENGDEINIISTNKSVYGYFAVGAQFDLELQWKSCSINTKAKIGSNNGKKIIDGQEIQIKDINKNYSKKKLNYLNSKIEKIRVIKGTNYDYFSDKGKKIFFENDLIVCILYIFYTLLLIFVICLINMTTLNLDVSQDFDSEKYL